MKYNPFKDPKFYTVAVESAFTLLTFFGGRYLSSDTYEAIRVVWASALPIFLLVIGQQFVEQAAAAKEAGLRSLGYFK